MVVVLLGITAVTSSAVGLVYRVTEAPIAQAKLHKRRMHWHRYSRRSIIRPPTRCRP